MNAALVETWEDFKISSAKITQEYLKNTHTMPLYLPDRYRNQKYFLEATKPLKGQKSEWIESIAKSRITPAHMEEISTPNPMDILREKVRTRFSWNLLVRASAYNTVRAFTILPIQ